MQEIHDQPNPADSRKGALVSLVSPLLRWAGRSAPLVHVERLHFRAMSLATCSRFARSHSSHVIDESQLSLVIHSWWWTPGLPAVLPVSKTARIGPSWRLECTPNALLAWWEDSMRADNALEFEA
jgi:hypothetical protein